MTTPQIENQNEPTLDEEIAQMALASEEPIEGLDEPTEGEPAPSDVLGPGEGAAFEPPTDGEPAPVTEPEPVDEVAKLKAENVQLVRDADQRKQEAETQQIDAHVRQYAAGYAQNLVETHGWTEEQATAYTESQRRAFMAEQQLGMERKDNLARRLSQEHGVSVASLMAYNTAEEMTNAATTQGPQDREFQQMKKEIAELKRGRIPAQNYTQQATRTATTNESSLLDQYNAGVRTPETEAAAKRNAYR